MFPLFLKPGTRVSSVVRLSRRRSSATTTRRAASPLHSRRAPASCRCITAPIRPAYTSTSDDDGKPLFPFGWGLSYTTFPYDRLRATQPTLKEGQNVHVTVDVTNTGSQDGDDVVQLYLRRDYSSVETPERELKGFTRLHLKAGETRTVSFELPQRNCRSGTEIASGLWNLDATRCGLAAHLKPLFRQRSSFGSALTSPFRTGGPDARREYGPNGSYSWRIPCLRGHVRDALVDTNINRAPA